MVLDDALYDKLTYVARFVLPGLTAFWLAISEIWGIPYGSQIGATLSAITVLMNTLLKLSTDNYDGDGEITVDTSLNEAGDGYTIAINTPMKQIADKKRITLKVKPE